jgi:hypothetical protein
MNMKEHILAALREQFQSWEELLSSLDEEEITAPHFDLDWSIKDVVAHLWAWQQVSIARMESGVQGLKPEYPPWILAIGEDWEEDSDRVNALTFENNQEKPWTEVHRNWRNGFLQFLELGNRISERNLLDGDWYPWLKGHSLASIFVASYDHHQERLEKLRTLLESKSHQ